MLLYADGWVQLDGGVNDLSTYWSDGFELVDYSDEEKRRYGYTTEQRRNSPITRYDDGGIGSVQWLNVTHDRAALLGSDGGWKVGGAFHLWVSSGTGTRPYEIPFRWPIKVDAGDPNGWSSRKEEATALAEAVLGLRRLGA